MKKQYLLFFFSIIPLVSLQSIPMWEERKSFRNNNNLEKELLERRRTEDGTTRSSEDRPIDNEVTKRELTLNDFEQIVNNVMSGAPNDKKNRIIVIKNGDNYDLINKFSDPDESAKNRNENKEAIKAFQKALKKYLETEQGLDQPESSQKTNEIFSIASTFDLAHPPDLTCQMILEVLQQLKEESQNSSSSDKEQQEISEEGYNFKDSNEILPSAPPIIITTPCSLPYIASRKEGSEQVLFPIENQQQEERRFLEKLQDNVLAHVRAKAKNNFLHFFTNKQLKPEDYLTLFWLVEKPNGEIVDQVERKIKEYRDKIFQTSNDLYEKLKAEKQKARRAKNKALFQRNELETAQLRDTQEKESIQKMSSAFQAFTKPLADRSKTIQDLVGKKIPDSAQVDQVLEVVDKTAIGAINLKLAGKEQRLKKSEKNYNNEKDQVVRLTNQLEATINQAFKEYEQKIKNFLLELLKKYKTIDLVQPKLLGKAEELIKNTQQKVADEESALEKIKKKIDQLKASKREKHASARGKQVSEITKALPLKIRPNELNNSIEDQRITEELKRLDEELNNKEWDLDTAKSDKHHVTTREERIVEIESQVRHEVLAEMKKRRESLGNLSQTSDPFYGSDRDVYSTPNNSLPDPVFNMLYRKAESLSTSPNLNQSMIDFPIASLLAQDREADRVKEEKAIKEDQGRGKEARGSSNLGDLELDILISENNGLKNTNQALKAHEQSKKKRKQAHKKSQDLYRNQVQEANVFFTKTQLDTRKNEGNWNAVEIAHQLEQQWENVEKTYEELLAPHLLLHSEWTIDKSDLEAQLKIKKEISAKQRTFFFRKKLVAQANDLLEKIRKNEKQIRTTINGLIKKQTSYQDTPHSIEEKHPALGRDIDWENVLSNDSPISQTKGVTAQKIENTTQWDFENEYENSFSSIAMPETMMLPLTAGNLSKKKSYHPITKMFAQKREELESQGDLQMLLGEEREKQHPFQLSLQVPTLIDSQISLGEKDWSDLRAQYKDFRSICDQLIESFQAESNTGMSCEDSSKINNQLMLLRYHKAKSEVREYKMEVLQREHEKKIVENKIMKTDPNEEGFLEEWDHLQQATAQWLLAQQELTKQYQKREQEIAPEFQQEWKTKIEGSQYEEKKLFLEEYGIIADQEVKKAEFKRLIIKEKELDLKKSEGKKRDLINEELNVLCEDFIKQSKAVVDAYTTLLGIGQQSLRTLPVDQQDRWQENLRKISYYQKIYQLQPVQIELKAAFRKLEKYDIATVELILQKEQESEKKLDELFQINTEIIKKLTAIKAIHRKIIELASLDKKNIWENNLKEVDAQQTYYEAKKYLIIAQKNEKIFLQRKQELNKALAQHHNLLKIASEPLIKKAEEVQRDYEAVITKLHELEQLSDHKKNSETDVENTETLKKATIRKQRYLIKQIEIKIDQQNRELLTYEKNIYARIANGEEKALCGTTWNSFSKICNSIFASYEKMKKVEEESVNLNKSGSNQSLLNARVKECSLQSIQFELKPLLTKEQLTVYTVFQKAAQSAYLKEMISLFQEKNLLNTINKIEDLLQHFISKLEATKLESNQLFSSLSLQREAWNKTKDLFQQLLINHEDNTKECISSLEEIKNNWENLVQKLDNLYQGALSVQDELPSIFYAQSERSVDIALGLDFSPGGNDFLQSSSNLAPAVLHQPLHFPHCENDTIFGLKQAIQVTNFLKLLGRRILQEKTTKYRDDFFSAFSKFEKVQQESLSTRIFYLRRNSEKIKKLEDLKKQAKQYLEDALKITDDWAQEVLGSTFLNPEEINEADKKAKEIKKWKEVLNLKT